MSEPIALQLIDSRLGHISRNILSLRLILQILGATVLSSIIVRGTGEIMSQLWVSFALNRHMITDHTNVSWDSWWTFVWLGLIVNPVRKPTSRVNTFQCRGIFLTDQLSLTHSENLIFHITLILNDTTYFLCATKGQVPSHARVVQIQGMTCVNLPSSDAKFVCCRKILLLHFWMTRLWSQCWHRVSSSIVVSTNSIRNSTVQISLISAFTRLDVMAWDKVKKLPKSLIILDKIL